MKNLIIALSALAITVSSCRKIIDIKLEEGDKKTVIEASLYEGTNDFRVKITQTGNFFGDNSPVIINNATVNLNDGVSTFPLSFTGNGNYYLLNFNAVWLAMVPLGKNKAVSLPNIFATRFSNSLNAGFYLNISSSNFSLHYSFKHSFCWLFWFVNFCGFVFL